jgi:hypothetical protein
MGSWHGVEKTQKSNYNYREVAPELEDWAEGLEGSGDLVLGIANNGMKC